MKTKVASLLLVLLLLFSSFALAAVAESKVLEIEAVASASPGDTVFVTVKTSQKYSLVGGIRMALLYDTSKFSYVVGSRSVKASGIDADSVTPDKDSGGKLHFVWEGYNGINLDGSIVTYQFKALDTATDTADFNLCIYEIYKADENYTPIVDVSSPLYVKHTVSFAEPDAQVETVKTIISSIGTVTYSDKSKSAIDAAFAAYNALTVLQQKQVTNYSDLVKALETYNTLKKESIQNANNAAAESYRNTYKTVLSLTRDTVTLNDKAAIEQALTAWDEIKLVDVKGILVAERNLLKLLTTRITELEKIKEDEEYEQQLKAEAVVLAEEFRQAYQYVLSLTEDTVGISDRMGVSSALGEIESMAFVNTYVVDILKPEYELLEKLLEKIDNLQIEEDPESSKAVTEADNFTRLFGWVLNLTEEQVTADDYADLVVAQTFFKLLSSDAKELLPGVEKLLDSLVAKAEELANSEDDTDTSDPQNTVVTETQKVTETETVTETVTKTKYSKQGISPMVLWSVVIFTVSITALALSAFNYFTKRRIYLSEMQEMEEDI